jgi:2-haloacid dehalogenase
LADATTILQKQYPDYHDLIQQYYDHWEDMIPGAIEENVSLLGKLNKNYSLYGLTNFSAETLPVAMKRFPFFDVFDGIVVSGAEKLIKPDKEIYLLLLNRFGLKAKECLFIDDSYPNIQTADELGFQTIHFHKGVNLEEELKKMSVL